MAGPPIQAGLRGKSRHFHRGSPATDDPPTHTCPRDVSIPASIKPHVSVRELPLGLTRSLFKFISLLENGVSAHVSGSNGSPLTQWKSSPTLRRPIQGSLRVNLNMNSCKRKERNPGMECSFGTAERPQPGALWRLLALQRVMGTEMVWSL